jgi:CSLREA domain-containing protein
MTHARACVSMRERESDQMGAEMSNRMQIAAGASLAAALAAPAGAQASDFTVTKLADTADGMCNSDCSLREALTQAAANNNSPTSDRILFQASVTGTIELAGSQLPTIDEPLRVLGPGANELEITGYYSSSRIFYVNTADGDDVTISGLALTDGTAASPPFGGAILNVDADLTLESSLISGNGASTGAGINSDYATLTVRNSTLFGNFASNKGGAISSYLGSVLVENSTLSRNTAASQGAGISAGNTALTVRKSTIASNTVDPYGSGYGGGIFAGFSIAHPVLDNTIVADNVAPNGPNLRSHGAADTFDTRFSLVESTSGAIVNTTVPSSNVFGQDPQLLRISGNGGPTATQALLPTSPAVDQGSSTGTDQRGDPRMVDFPGVPLSEAAGANSSDIGAFELQTVACGGRAANIVASNAAGARASGRGGTPGGTIIGTPKADVIVGSDSRDVIKGLGGRDLVCAGAGNDKVIGGAAGDRLLGEAGNDLLLGSTGRDRLIGGAGRDTLRGGPGRDRLRGGPGRDKQRQ